MQIELQTLPDPKAGDPPEPLGPVGPVGFSPK